MQRLPATFFDRTAFGWRNLELCIAISGAYLVRDLHTLFKYLSIIYCICFQETSSVTDRGRHTSGSSMKSRGSRGRNQSGGSGYGSVRFQDGEQGQERFVRRLSSTGKWKDQLLFSDPETTYFRHRLLNMLDNYRLFFDSSNMLLLWILCHVSCHVIYHVKYKWRIMWPIMWSFSEYKWTFWKGIVQKKEVIGR